MSLLSGWNRLLLALHLSAPNNNNILTPQQRLLARKAYWSTLDKKQAAKRLKENREIKAQFIQERQDERDELEQRMHGLLRQLGQTTDVSRQLQIKGAVEAIEADCDAITVQENLVSSTFEAWNASNDTCDQPRKEYSWAAKDFAYKKDLFLRAWQLHNIASPQQIESAKQFMDAARESMQSAEAVLESAQQKLAAAEDVARKLEKDFEQAAAAPWPQWKSEYASVATELLKAA